MHLRYARHTDNLEALEQFYTQIIGLERIGGFKEHADYNGVFLAPMNGDWHLEFTVSPDAPKHMPDEDDLLVFYLSTEIEIEQILETAKRNNIYEVAPKNPYWKDNGYTLTDPDGYRVVIALKSPELRSQDELTKEVREKGIHDWNSLTKFVAGIPYGRNANRNDLSLVIKENKGTCSSKHALLKEVSEQNGIKNVQLIMSMYKMNEKNTPKIGDELSKNGIDYIPEAHCYLKINGKRYDLTSRNAIIDNLVPDIMMEMEIAPRQVSEYKVSFHKDFLRQWLHETKMSMSFEELWKIREQCIANLSL